MGGAFGSALYGLNRMLTARNFVILPFRISRNWVVTLIWSVRRADALIAQPFDFLYRTVGAQQVLVAIRARQSVLLLLFLFRQLFGSLLRFQAVDLHALRIDDLPLLGGIFRRHLIAVMGDSLLVHPFVELMIRCAGRMAHGDHEQGCGED